MDVNICINRRKSSNIKIAQNHGRKSSYIKIAQSHGQKKGWVVGWCRENHFRLLVYGKSRGCSHLEAELWKRALKGFGEHPPFPVLSSAKIPVLLETSAQSQLLLPDLEPSLLKLGFSSSVEVTHTGLCHSAPSAQPHATDQSTNGPQSSLLFHTIPKVPSTANPGAV